MPTSVPDRSGSGIDHLTIAVPDLEASVAFSTPALAVIGITTVLRVPADPATGRPDLHGYGWAGVEPFFGLFGGGTVGTDVHVAFTVPTREDVQRSYDTALAHGGRSLHAPAVREEHHADHYGGFVLDPDGIDVEAVCHHPAP